MSKRKPDEECGKSFGLPLPEFEWEFIRNEVDSINEDPETLRKASLSSWVINAALAQLTIDSAVQLKDSDSIETKDTSIYLNARVKSKIEEHIKKTGLYVSLPEFFRHAINNMMVQTLNIRNLHIPTNPIVKDRKDEDEDEDEEMDPEEFIFPENDE